MLVVQGGPGTGKTVVALHRAAYLLYTHRFPLEDQGVLVIGPNRVFLRYIERVLPSLGEAGVEQVVLADLVPDVRFAGRGDRHDAPLTRAGSRATPACRDVIDKAVTRPRAPAPRGPRRPVPLRLPAARAPTTSARIVKRGAPPLPPPQRRPPLGRGRGLGGAGRHVARRATSSGGEVRQALRDAAGGPRRARADVAGAHAGRSCCTTCSARRRCCAWPPPRHARRRRVSGAATGRAPSDVDDVRWTSADVALLDDAREVLGPRPTQRNGKIDEADEIRTYGHIVIDEVQDLTPMQLQDGARRSLNGSMTVVGDIAQATGPLAPDELGRRARATCPTASRAG